MDTVTPASGSISGMLATGIAPVTALWFHFVQYLPQVLSAIVVFIIGWIIATVIGDVVRRALRFAGLDALVNKHGINERFKIDSRSQYALVSRLVGTIVKWVLLLGTLGIVCDILNLTQVNAFIGTILAYIPNVIVAIVIMVVGLIASQIVSELVEAGVSTSGLPISNSKLLGSIAKYAIIVFSVMAALTQLQIVPQLIEIAFAGLVFALSLAFGLGGKDHMSDLISKLREQA